MKISQLFHLTAAAVDTSADEEFSSLLKSLDTRGGTRGWQDDFQAVADFVMTSDDFCQNLQKCVNSMLIWFERNLELDPTNNYVILAFCGKDEERKPDVNGNVWWYDGLESDNK